ncbi:MAG TPA: F0F1 ATP synthase subunit epsilon [Thermoanaerobaculia bacterium]|nr:F0F1 ATP synthase subunit epsilon [Thermoanaerobaculia bacterium]
MAKSFHFLLITPERVVLDREATFVAFPAFDGEVGVLAHRAPLIAKLGAGELRVESPQGEARFFVAGGFAQMVDNKLTILSEEARLPGELDAAQAGRELSAALASPARDEAALAARDRAVARARALLRVAT